MYAAVGSEAMMRQLIEAGADVNARNGFQATALLWCSNLLPRVRLLVEHGADVNVRSKQGHTPIDVAPHNANGLEILKLLISKGASPEGPVDVAAVGAMLDRLLHHGHVLNCGPRSWRTKAAAAS